MADTNTTSSLSSFPRYPLRCVSRCRSNMLSGDCSADIFLGTDMAMTVQDAVQTETSGVESHGLCRICGAPLLHKVVDLGMSPLCESFLTAQQLDQVEPYFPLKVFVCSRCLLVQLKDVRQPRRDIHGICVFLLLLHKLGQSCGTILPGDFGATPTGRQEFSSSSLPAMMATFCSTSVRLVFRYSVWNQRQTLHVPRLPGTYRRGSISLGFGLQGRSKQKRGVPILSSAITCSRRCRI